MAILDAFKKKGTVKKSAAPKKEKEVKSEKTALKVVKTPKVSTQSHHAGLNISEVLREARITEKASMLSERGAYVFDVHQASTKDMVRKAIIAKFNVFPVKINIMNMSKKRRQSRTTGVMHPTGGGRKAIVFLKKGEKIDFV
jgi:large subunit ribosomal protein L23